MRNNKFQSLAKQRQSNNYFGNYFEVVNGEKSTKFVDIINRAKQSSLNNTSNPESQSKNPFMFASPAGGD
jgi:hypothetical protein